MSITTQRKSGMLLLATSVVALIVFLAVGFLHGSWHYVAGGSIGNDQWAVYSGKLGVNNYYLIPILLCGAIGAVFLARASRKPPKLPQ